MQDLELPTSEKASWWHLAGYKMWSADADEMEEEDEEEEGEAVEEAEDEQEMEEDEEMEE